MEGTIIFIVQQLAYQSPMLVAYGGGVLLGVMWYHHCPKPAMCCLLGCGVMLLAALVMAGVQATLMQTRGSDHGSIIRYASMMSVVSLLGSVLRAGGLCLVIAGVFMGRNKPMNDDFI